MSKCLRKSDTLSFKWFVLFQSNLSEVIGKASSAIRGNVQEKAAEVAEKIKNPGKQIFGFTTHSVSTSNPLSSEAVSGTVAGSRLHVHVEQPVTKDSPRTDDILPKFGTSTKPVDDYVTAVKSSQSRAKHRSKMSKPIRPTLTQKVSVSCFARRDAKWKICYSLKYLLSYQREINRLELTYVQFA